MASPQVTLLDNLLTQIIQETATGSNTMVQLNTQVQTAKAGLHQSQISDSGTIIVRRLELWETDWVGVKTKLDDLNTRVTEMRASLLRGLQEALDQAQSGA
jgi:hypothetical protein